MNAQRIACLWIQRFITDIAQRANPSLAGRPLAVAEGADRREIVATNAQAQGVAIGMTPKQARAACPGLVVVARNEAAERSITKELLDALESCSPYVEGALPGVYFFDASGLPNGESNAVGAAIALASELGFTSCAAIADDKFTARCAAVTAGSGCSIVATGTSAAFLAPLPVTLLPLAPGDADRFALLGLHTLGQIAALPLGPLAARFGERSRMYAQLAGGRDDTPLWPRRSATIYEERFAFDGAVDKLETLFFALRGCIAGVAGRLAGAAQVCDRVEIVLALDATDVGLQSSQETGPPDAVRRIAVSLAEPTASAATMFDLARISIESCDQLHPVEALIVRAAPCSEPPPQLALFDGTAASRRTALAATLARLRAALSPADIVTMQTQLDKSRLPERMQRAQPIASPRQFDAPKNGKAHHLAVDPEAAKKKKLHSKSLSERIAARHFTVDEAAIDLRRCEPPQKLDDNKTEGYKLHAPALRLLDPPRPMQSPNGRQACAGPFRFSESWWERPVERDYYQMADDNGALVLAFRDVRTDRWYVQGVFD